MTFRLSFPRNPSDRFPRIQMLLAAGAVVIERRLSELEVRARLLAQTARVAIPGLIPAVSLALAPVGLPLLSPPLLARFVEALGFDLAAEREPRNSILNSESRPRVLSLEHTELLPQSKDLKVQVAAGAEEDAEAADHADEEGNHGIRFIPWADPGVRVNCLIVLPHRVLAAHTVFERWKIARRAAMSGQGT